MSYTSAGYMAANDVLYVGRVAVLFDAFGACHEGTVQRAYWSDQGRAVIMFVDGFRIDLEAKVQVLVSP